MSLTWCQIGASLCLIGVSAWGIEKWACGEPEPAPIEVIGPAAPAEETAAVVRWAMEHAGARALHEPAPSTAAAGGVRVVGSEPRATPRPTPIEASRAIAVPANTVKGGGKVSYVGSPTRGGSAAVGQSAARDFRRALGRGQIRQASNWVPSFSGTRRRR